MILSSNLTETSRQILSKRAAYVASHREYFYYLHLLLDRAALPQCNISQPNLTTMAAMVAELQELCPTAPWLNVVVLGRMLHRVLAPLLTWHGGRQNKWHPLTHVPLFAETTVYRFPEVRKARIGFERFNGEEWNWSNDHDQWQSTASFLLDTENDNPASRRVGSITAAAPRGPALITFDLHNALQEI
jgi:hypothetical protein